MTGHVLDVQRERRVVPDTLATALAEWADAIGSDHTLAVDEIRDLYARSTSPQGTRPLAVLKPGSLVEVQDVLRVARRHDIPIYPISGGKNWGLGDACAVTDDQVIVDLARMNRIHEIDANLGYAVVEPGVTQGQMHEHLRANRIPLWFDATGAGPDASIIGNMMERGYGHTPLGDRFQHATAFEVVLPDGRILRTGFSHYHSSQTAHVFKPGLGPSLDGLFTQSNLGIVTRATVWLMPQPPCFEAFAFSVAKDEQLGAVIEALRPLRMLGILQSAVHIANDLRVVSAHQRYPWDWTDGKTPLPRQVREKLRRKQGLGAWNVLGGLYGTKATVRGGKKALRHALRFLARPRFINDRTLGLAESAAALCGRVGIARSLVELMETVKPAYVLLKGEPAAEHLEGMAWRNRSPRAGDSSDPLEKGHGFMWLSAVVPQTGAAAEDLRRLVEPIFEEFGFEPLTTFIMTSARALVCPITVCYDKQNQDETARAQQCYSRLFDEVMIRGYHPYRAGIQSMSKLSQGSSVFWEVVREIKHALDPKDVVAPGRYLPDC